MKKWIESRRRACPCSPDTPTSSQWVPPSPARQIGRASALSHVWYDPLPLPHRSSSAGPQRLRILAAWPPFPLGSH